MYAGLAIAYLGGTLLAGTWWLLATLPIALMLVRYLVIGPEEDTSPAPSARPTSTIRREFGAGSSPAQAAPSQRGQCHGTGRSGVRTLAAPCRRHLLHRGDALVVIGFTTPTSPQGWSACPGQDRRRPALSTRGDQPGAVSRSRSRSPAAMPAMVSRSTRSPAVSASRWCRTGPSRSRR